MQLPSQLRAKGVPQQAPFRHAVPSFEVKIHDERVTKSQVQVVGKQYDHDPVPVTKRLQGERFTEPQRAVVIYNQPELNTSCMLLRVAEQHSASDVSNVTRRHFRQPLSASHVHAQKTIDVGHQHVHHNEAKPTALQFRHPISPGKERAMERQRKMAHHHRFPSYQTPTSVELQRDGHVR